MDLKAALLNTLSAFTKTPEIAIHFWKIIGEIDVRRDISPKEQFISLSSFQLLAPMENSDIPALAYEIEEFEVPSQKYTFLKSILKFLQPIISQQLKSNVDIRTLGHCVVFLVNQVLLKISTRTFKSLQEKVSEIKSIRSNTIFSRFFSGKSLKVF